MKSKRSWFYTLTSASLLFGLIFYVNNRNTTVTTGGIGGSQYILVNSDSNHFKDQSNSRPLRDIAVAPQDEVSVAERLQIRLHNMNEVCNQSGIDILKVSAE